MNSLIKFALEFAHMSDAEISDLSAKMPAFGRLAAAAKQLEPILWPSFSLSLSKHGRLSRRTGRTLYQ
jgi:hypothetical protein